MSVSEIKKFLGNLTSHITFIFNGKRCGVDPFAPDNFDMWCGDSTMTAKSIDEVMETPFFDGAALKNIVDEIESLDM